MLPANYYLNYLKPDYLWYYYTKPTDAILMGYQTKLGCLWDLACIQISVRG